LAVTNFNIEIDNQKFFKKDELIPDKIELKSIKFAENLINRSVLEVTENERREENDTNSNPSTEVNNFIVKDKELNKIKPTIPDPINFVQIPMDSFEIEVDLVNHLSTSGAIENFNYKVHDKPPNMIQVPSSTKKDNSKFKIEVLPNDDDIKEV
jgi:hypothetical protein